MANFAPIFDVTMKAEGGYVNARQTHRGEIYKGNVRTNCADFIVSCS